MRNLGWGVIFVTIFGTVVLLPTIIRTYRENISGNLTALYDEPAAILTVEYFPLFWLAVPIIIIGVTLYAMYRGREE